MNPNKTGCTEAERKVEGITAEEHAALTEYDDVGDEQWK